MSQNIQSFHRCGPHLSSTRKLPGPPRRLWNAPLLEAFHLHGKATGPHRLQGCSRRLHPGVASVS